MATARNPDRETAPLSRVAPRREPSELDSLRTALGPLASLKLTVVLFAVSIFLIFAGTLAQVEKDIWQVVHEYFRTWIAWIELSDFQFFLPSKSRIGGSFAFPFPGGWLIGMLMGLNLLAAHAVRFKFQARGSRLMAGLIVLAVGVLATWMVVAAGDNKGGMQEVPMLAWSTLWILFKGGLAAIWLTALYAMIVLIVRGDPSRTFDIRGLLSFVIALGAVLAWLVWDSSFAINDSSMRILWQLVKGGAASAILLAGCLLAFKKRAGIVLLHAGIMLMMANELIVHTLHIEAQMPIREGETINYAQDIRTVELAIVDSADQDEDDVVVVPRSLLLSGEPVADDDLPFDIEVVEYLPNSTVRPVTSDDQNVADAGYGLKSVAVERRAGAGTDIGGKVDMASMYARLTPKNGDQPLGTFLFSQFQIPHKIEVDGKTYEVALRFKRHYKPYSMALSDVRFDKYQGTSMAKNYSSDVRLVDPSRNVDREVHIWMNNPLRYAGDTFYQSEFQVDPKTGEEITVLQVVSNSGWMVPYVACMIVMTGMLAQFCITLLRFLNRRAKADAAVVAEVVEDSRPSAASGRKKRSKAKPIAEAVPDQSSLWDIALPVGVVLFAALWMARVAMPPRAESGGVKFYEAGQIPVVYEGRVKPLDTIARNSLLVISDRQTFEDAGGKRQPAVRWLLDVLTDAPAAEQHKIFRIENHELLDTLGLKRRKGHRYSIAEFLDHMQEFDAQAKLAHQVREQEKPLSAYQKKVLELNGHLKHYLMLRESHAFPRIARESLKEDFMAEMGRRRDYAKFTLPRIVPPLPSDDAKEQKEEAQWQPFTFAVFDAVAQRIVGPAGKELFGEKPNPATLQLVELFSAYREGDSGKFNDELADYQAFLTTNAPENLNSSKVRFETFFNHFEPFYYCCLLYLIAFILSILALLGFSGPLNRAAFWLILFTFLLHTAALIGRMYISGRPPVTNLYSSAVFIGWGGVMLGMILERIYRLGVGNIVAAVSGAATLEIAHLLANEGDTFVVLQAVLDTQFWLATHVTCITFGYTTTFLAGLLGMFYILAGVFTPKITPRIGKDVARMIYGILCFAIFFSFVGTVLGGLWADDSWGRFWGWDPKENGALIIVLWNALVLHARWDGMVKDRGLAILAVGGNIATSWSWFGVNELGTGLHSYGFTEGRAVALVFFILSQLAIIAIGSIPRHMWASFRSDGGRAKAKRLNG